MYNLVFYGTVKVLNLHFGVSLQCIDKWLSALLSSGWLLGEDYLSCVL